MKMQLNKTLIENMLYEKANVRIIQLMEAKIPSGYGMKIKPVSMNLPKMNMKQMTKSTFGRFAIVDRIRNGKIQYNKKIDTMGKGYKLLPNGQVIKMSPREAIARARAAKRAAKKRKIHLMTINRNRMLSLQKRKYMIG